MGTPASVVSEPPPWQAPTEARGRKQASANIFQDAELLQIQGLFQRSGDQLAEERAQIIWECAGDQRVAEALKRLRRKRPPRQNTSDARSTSWLGGLEPLTWPHHEVPPTGVVIRSTERLPHGWHLKDGS
uniref:Arginine vasopressin-induced protein 1 n=1 Tax=Sus scrofa TaxID=9823 RepID=A0A8D0R753_PIG